MSGKPSLKAVIDEKIMEQQAFCGEFAQGVNAIINDLNSNEKSDHLNDACAIEANNHLLSALSAQNMRDYEDCSRHINAALQKLHKQQMLDLEDDLPRTEARIKLTRYAEKANAQAQACRGLNADFQDFAGNKQQNTVIVINNNNACSCKEEAISILNGAIDLLRGRRPSVNQCSNDALRLAELTIKQFEEV